MKFFEICERNKKKYNFTKQRNRLKRFPILQQKNILRKILYILFSIKSQGYYYP